MLGPCAHHAFANLISEFRQCFEDGAASFAGRPRSPVRIERCCHRCKPLGYTDTAQLAFIFAPRRCVEPGSSGFCEEACQICRQPRARLLGFERAAEFTAECIKQKRSAARIGHYRAVQPPAPIGDRRRRREQSDFPNVRIEPRNLGIFFLHPFR